MNEDNNDTVCTLFQRQHLTNSSGTPSPAFPSSPNIGGRFSNPVPCGKTPPTPSLPVSVFDELISQLPALLSTQWDVEESVVRSGKRLMHSDYFKTLAALACDIGLDSMSPAAADSSRWTWFRRYCTASRVADSLIRRTPLPDLFAAEVHKKVIN